MLRGLPILTLDRVSWMWRLRWPKWVYWHIQKVQQNGPIIEVLSLWCRRAACFVQSFVASVGSVRLSI